MSDQNGHSDARIGQTDRIVDGLIDALTFAPTNIETLQSLADQRGRDLRFALTHLECGCAERIRERNPDLEFYR